MAKKKYEFKPDKISLGILHKLYLTKRQRMTILRWTLLGVVLLVLSLLQDVILCRLDIFGATTDLVPCAIFLSCMLLGTQSGCLYALIAASLFQFSGGGPGYSTTTLITLLYNDGIKDGNMGKASAIAVIIFVILSIMTVIQKKITAED